MTRSSGVVRSGPTRSAHRELDLPTCQAVDELRTAVRRVRELERESLDGKTMVSRAHHSLMLQLAHTARSEARAALESLLEES